MNKELISVSAYLVKVFIILQPGAAKMGGF
jgi:hypothetical protein